VILPNEKQQAIVNRLAGTSGMDDGYVCEEYRVTREELQERHPDDPLLFADGFDGAIIGTAAVNGKTVVAYSTSRCIDILMKEKMTEEDALDHFYYNTASAYVGERTPVFIEDN
jgi:hypothetical protein